MKRVTKSGVVLIELCLIITVDKKCIDCEFDCRVLYCLVWKAPAYIWNNV